MTMYAATINTPGYLPMDDDLALFATTQEAWQYLVSEVERAWDEYPEDENGACIEAHTAMHNLDQSREGTVYAPTPGYEGDHDLGVAYGVTLWEGRVWGACGVEDCLDCRPLFDEDNNVILGSE